ncbi:DNA-binding protein [Halogeometricum pallidum JCM 14848]|uniref:DNA-binding protein n=1 Tax=Halogeometricum pallidum JCM 14848 TaxID=1227487 RepID=M0D075_HALPD|nr:helix-turn-helix domain-containing protein [Halogeometricum pallidum]ELZ28062.1 DNA-binding protein [Halogeometricum pallidum JCM 14848]
MRYATVKLTWPAGLLRPLEANFAREEAVRVEAILYVNPGPEGEYVELLELRGDLERASAVLASSPDVLEYDVTGSDGHGVAYVQCRTSTLVGDLLAVLHDNEIVVDWPMHLTDEGGRGLEVTVLGTNRAIQRAVADLPAGVEFTLERLGEYDAGGLGDVLTDRQSEVLELAVAEGYYDVPRRTTHRELAETLGVAAGTVSEHLQRIESKIIKSRIR